MKKLKVIVICMVLFCLNATVANCEINLSDGFNLQELLELVDLYIANGQSPGLDGGDGKVDLIDILNAVDLYLSGMGSDKMGPIVSITSHQNGEDVSTSPITVTGTAVDVSQIDFVTVNGKSATNTGTNFSTWEVEIILQEGSNIITVSGEDISSNKNEDISITITYTGTDGGGNDYPDTLIATINFNDFIIDGGNLDGYGSGEDITLTPDGKYIYAAVVYYATIWHDELGGFESTESHPQVIVISTSDYSLVDSIELGSEGTSLNKGWGIDITPDGNYVYVGQNFAAKVTVIRTSDNSIVDSISFNNKSGIYRPYVNPNGQYVYVGDTGNDTVWVIDTSNHSVVDSIAVGDKPYGMAVTPDGSYLYVMDHASYDGISAILKIDTSDNTIVDSIDSAIGSPKFGTVTPDGNSLYTAFGTFISAMDTTDNTTVDTIEGGEYQVFDIKASPDGKYIYAADASSANYHIPGIAVIRIADNSIVTHVDTYIETNEGPSGTGYIGNPKFLEISPDGKTVYAADSKAAIYVIGLDE